MSDAELQAAEADQTESHELNRVFAEHGLALDETLEGMLNEHFSHRTERRGCGFTQATRHLAALVNRPRDYPRHIIAKLFPKVGRSCTAADDAAIAALRTILRDLPGLLEREESRLLSAIISDLVLPSAKGELQELPPCFDALKVGTCPLAEKYFLEIGDGFVRRRGRVNILVSSSGQPLLVEKLNLGDDHSCISVTELWLNGVRLPPGCLFAVQRDQGIEVRPNRALPGSIVPVEKCGGFRFLRLTTLAVSPANRRRAFTRHFQSQVDAGLFAPGEATVEQLRRVAEGQL